MNYLKGIWAWYLARKLWLKIIIAIFVLAAITAPFSEDTTTEEAAPVPTQSASPTPSQTPSEEPSPSESPSATESASAIPYSPVQLRSAALGDLADMRKDVADAKERINDGGLARLYGNVLELSFNLGQLQSIDPSEDIAEEWNKRLGNLEAAIDKFTDGLSADSVSKSRGHLDGILSAISSLENFVKTVK